MVVDENAEALTPEQALAQIYVLNGFFLGRELFVLGAWIIAAVTGSAFMPDVAGRLFLTFATGGSLIVTGLILRRRVRRTSHAS